MDFTNAGDVEEKRASYRAHVQWKDAGVNRNIRGPVRPDPETAQNDLEKMRSSANGMGREDGFSAIAAEAKRLRDGKAPKEDGSVEPFGMGFRARIQWKEAGSINQAHGPRRYEQRRAQEDLEAIREAASAQAIAAEAR